MAKIIKFPGRVISSEFISPDVRMALNKLEPKLRQKLEAIIDSTARKYSFICEPVEISLPVGTTDEQFAAINSLVEKQRAAILELVNELIDAKVLHELQVKPKS